MHKPIPIDIKQWTEQHVGKIKSARQLQGGISTSIYGLETEQGRYVLRVIDNAEWLAEEPDIARHEALVLKIIADADVPSPILVAYDDGANCSLPVVLSTWLPGQVVLAPDNLDKWLEELAQTLAKIHMIQVEKFDWSYLAWYSPEKFAPPKWSKHPQVWQKAAARRQQTEARTKRCFIHRDYHPANVLFDNGKVSGVVDWINGCYGDAGVDVSGCRHDIACLHGVDAAHQFLHYYEAATGIKHQLLWDIDAMLNFYDSAENVTLVLQTWHDLGRTDLTLDAIYQRADAFLLDIMKRLDV